MRVLRVTGVLLVLGVASAFAWLHVGGVRAPAFETVRDGCGPRRHICSTATAR